MRILKNCQRIGFRLHKPVSAVPFSTLPTAYETPIRQYVAAMAQLDWTAMVEKIKR